MNRMRAMFVIARRDYVATVWSRTFLLFLSGPLFPILFGALFGASEVWLAEVAGFACGFGLSFLLAPGGPARLLPSRDNAKAMPRSPP